MRKKILAALLAVVVAFSSLPVSSVWGGANRKSASKENTVYVSLDGREGASGTIDDPFSNIQAASDSLKGRTGPKDPGMVYIREGTYRVSESIKITGEHSYIAYSAYEGETVKISGAVNLNNDNFITLDQAEGSQFSSKSRIPEAVWDQIYVYDLKAEDIPAGDIKKNGFNWPQQTFQPELVVDGEMQTLARYPNDGVLSRPQILAGKEKNQSNVDKLNEQEKFNYDNAQAAGANEGDRPRNWYFDKTDTPKTYEEMLAMKAPVLYCADDELAERMTTWAPPSEEGESQEDQPEKTDIDNTLFETNGWISGYFENNYANDMVRIYSTDGEKRLIRCKYPSLQGVQDLRIQLSAVNLLCELDQEGEYYIDRWNGNDVLYYYPGEAGIQDQNITLTSLNQPFFQLEGAEGVTIQGIHMEGGTGYGIILLDCESCQIIDCEFSNLSLDAVKIGEHNATITTDPSYTTSRGGHNNKVINSLFHDLGGGGVYLAGGDRKTLERGENLVTNCEFYNISRLQTYTPAVYLEGVGNTAANNYIHDTPHMVIQIMGNDMLVTRNRIENTCTNASDQAPIYAGRDWTWLGNVISYNYIKGVKGSGNHGIYMDDGMSGLIIRNNIFEDISGSALFSNCGYGQIIEDNIVISDKPAVEYWGYTTGVGKRPIANEKVLEYRYYSVLRPGDGGDYTNTQENIENWYEHYQADYPYLRDRYFPSYEDEEQGTNPNSLFVPAYQSLKRTIVVGTGEGLITKNQVETFQDEFFNENQYRASSVEELGLDLSSGQFSGQSPLKKVSGYGAKWVNTWNKNFDLEECGIQPDSKKLSLE